MVISKKTILFKSKISHRHGNPNTWFIIEELAILPDRESGEVDDKKKRKGRSHPRSGD